jgi:hypothetical protein
MSAAYSAGSTTVFFDGGGDVIGGDEIGAATAEPGDTVAATAGGAAAVPGASVLVGFSDVSSERLSSAGAGAVIGIAAGGGV